MITLYMIIWLGGAAFFGYEYWALTRHPERSILLHQQQIGHIAKSFVISTDPGRSLSLWLGWTGLGLMIIMNLYTMRKKFAFMRPLGSLKSWLDFHIFCGLLGPTLILYHCNFKVRGVVAISFWSMMVSFSSGVIGRYFYVQLLTRKSDLEDFCERILKRIDQSFEKRNLVIPPAEKAQYLTIAMQMAGAPLGDAQPSMAAVFIGSVVADIRLMFKDIPVGPTWPKKLSPILRAYAEAKRKQAFLGPFQKMMGYWHTFHFPFAIFMYVAAVIHVVSSLLLGV